MCRKRENKTKKDENEERIKKGNKKDGEGIFERAG